MNFLAHCLIAERSGAAVGEPRDGLIAGGLLGDLVKGPVPPDWPLALQQGIRLHRRIDAFSNQLDELRVSCRRFPPELRRLAPALVDIISDHFLAADWRDWHSTALPVFSARCYRLAMAHRHRFRARQRRYLDWLTAEDLLAGYRHLSVMQRGLCSVTRRLDKSHLDQTLLEFVADELPRLRMDFQGCFPPLLAHGRVWVASQLRRVQPQQARAITSEIREQQL